MYFDRRVKEGRTKRDIIRILQRYIAHEVYRSSLAADSPGRGSGSPHNCRPPGLTYR